MLTLIAPKWLHCPFHLLHSSMYPYKHMYIFKSHMLCKLNLLSYFIKCQLQLLRQWSNINRVHSVKVNKVDSCWINISVLLPWAPKPQHIFPAACWSFNIRSSVTRHHKHKLSFPQQLHSAARKNTAASLKQRLFLSAVVLVSPQSNMIEYQLLWCEYVNIHIYAYIYIWESWFQCQL